VIYVYGVVSASERTEVEALGVGQPHAGVRRVTHGSVAALVSDVESEPLAAARDLRAHWKVLDEAATRATVLPVRFGTVMQDERALVDEFLGPEHDHLNAQLAELAGKVQLTVKGFYEEDRLLREVVERSPAVAKLRERVQSLPEAAGYYERIRLGELVAAEVEQARERDTALVMERLEPHAVAARREEPASGEGAVHVAFLVERDRVDHFSHMVQQLAGDVADHMRLRYIGPLPPYSFAGDESAAGRAAWA
jgi:Gas vesicle synthesis protein GvpL/GvpF